MVTLLFAEGGFIQADWREAEHTFHVQAVRLDRDAVIDVVAGVQPVGP